MRITAIEINNFRAFRGVPLRLDLHRTGKNLLVYGENGSGKSSLFFALKDFLECAGKGNITQFPYRNIFKLLIENIIDHAENDLSRRPFGEEWRAIKETAGTLNKRSPKQKQELIDRIKTFNNGLRVKLEELQSKAQEILNEFAYQIEIDLHFGGIEYDSQTGALDKQIVGLSVGFFGARRDDHHLFLNEAKLSAIAISIFFAALLQQPVSRLRVLALDDVLIGLDMSNRLPVLDILDKHFSDYQIFFFTYDKPWFEIVKNHIESRKLVDKWEYAEFFIARTDEYDVTVYAPEKKFLERARLHLNNHDWKAAAVYARTHFEAKLKKFCDKKGLKVRYKEKANELKSDDFWQAVEEARQHKSDWKTRLTDQLIQDVKKYRKVILNPLNHADWSTIHRLEVEHAMTTIEQLEKALEAIP